MGEKTYRYAGGDWTYSGPSYKAMIILGALTGLVVGILCALVHIAAAKDDGRFANSPLKPWFDKLSSAKGLCCSFADGRRVENVDWDTGGDNRDTQTEGGHYRVRLNGQWIDVPDTALVTEPNRYGPAVVWPYQDINGKTQIRCFIPGAGA